MEIRVNYGSLEQAILKMGAEVREIPLDTYKLGDISPISIELEHGIDVALKDIEINEGGLLGYQGHQVVLYIPDQWHIEEVIEDGSKGKRVHVANCQTLEEMKKKGRFERYVVRNGLSPDFEVSGTTREGEQLTGVAQLQVCMYCIRYLNYDNANNLSKNERWEIVRKFTLDQFFARYSSYFKYMPQRRAGSLGGESYPANWKEVSRRYRTKVDWTCEECQVDLSEPSHHKLLHVHHKNGVKSDNKSENLQALCLDCHSKAPLHEHLFVKKPDRALIQRLRRKQSVYRSPADNSHADSDWDEAIRIADPAVHGLIYELREQEYAVPDVGVDIVNPENHRVVLSNAELVWQNTQEIVVLEISDECSDVEELGWRVFTAQGLLDWLTEQSS